MAGQTTALKIPYPTGTDRVADGDNAMQALAERVEARMSWGVLAYSQITNPLPGVGGSYVDLSNMQVTINVPAGRRVSVRVRGAGLGMASQLLFGLQLIEITAGRAVLTAAETIVPPAEGQGFGVAVEAILMPSAGTHQYGATALTNPGGGTFFADPSRPAFIVAEDIGPVSTA